LLFGAGIGAIEIIFEKGQKEDWFNSDFILILSLVAFFALLIGITWEYYQEQPAVDIEMFTNRNFTLACILIFTIRFITFGTTFLIPFMAQTLLDYPAMDAGMILLPGSITLMLMIQVVGYLIDKFDARLVIGFGLVTVGIAIWHITSFSLQVGFTDLVFARMFQMFGLAFLSTTMMAVAFYYVKPEKSDRASSLISIAGNTGASMGIAFTTTYIAKMTQVHINNFGYHTTNSNPNFTETIANLSQKLRHAGLNSIQATDNAYQIMWDSVLKQATMNAVIDTFYMFILFIVLVIPIVLLLKPKKTNGNSGGH
jgi:MFS transporter, DHA2 family, multidrug resistance protein